MSLTPVKGYDTTIDEKKPIAILYQSRFSCGLSIGYQTVQFMKGGSRLDPLKALRHDMMSNDGERVAKRVAVLYLLV